MRIKEKQNEIIDLLQKIGQDIIAIRNKENFEEIEKIIDKLDNIHDKVFGL